jgi:hypothetical protein
LQTYAGSGRPGIPAFKLDPAVDVGFGQESGDAGMCNHFRFGFSQDAHTHGVSKQPSDGVLLEAYLLGNRIEGDLTARWDHLWDMVAADCIDADQVFDLQNQFELHLIRNECLPKRI